MEKVLSKTTEFHSFLQSRNLCQYDFLLLVNFCVVVDPIGEFWNLDVHTGNVFLSTSNAQAQQASQVPGTSNFARQGASNVTLYAKSKYNIIIYSTRNSKIIKKVLQCNLLFLIHYQHTGILCQIWFLGREVQFYCEAYHHNHHYRILWRGFPDIK